MLEQCLLVDGSGRVVFRLGSNIFATAVFKLTVGDKLQLFEWLLDSGTKVVGM